MSNYAQIQGGARSRTSNRWDTKQLVTMALMAALAIVLSFGETLVIPGVSFLKLDVALVPATVVGFAYGAGPGMMVAIVYIVAHAAITSNWVGALMNAIVALSYIVPAALIYKRNHTFKGGIIALVVGSLCLIVGAIIANLIIDPIFYFMPFDTVVGYIVPAFIPFNVIKSVVVSVLVGLVYKAISNFITPEKSQVKGR